MRAHLVRLARQRTIAALALNVVGMSIEMAMGQSLAHVPLWPSVGSTAISATLLAILLALRDQTSPRLAASFFVINNVAIVAALWITSDYYAQGVGAWMPFQANKLGALMVAVLAPEQIWVGLLCIGLFIGTALMKASWFSVVASPPPLLAVEIWTQLIFGTFSVLLLIYRTRSDRLRDDLVEAQAKSHAVTSFAQRLLAVSDLANTPLQILELNVPLLKDAAPRDSVLRIERAIETLRRWHTILDREAAQLDWNSDAESFDAQAVLHQVNGGSPP